MRLFAHATWRIREASDAKQQHNWFRAYRVFSYPSDLVPLHAATFLLQTDARISLACLARLGLDWFWIARRRHSSRRGLAREPVFLSSIPGGFAVPFRTGRRRSASHTYSGSF